MSGAQNPFSNEALGFDPDALTKRYAAEREKRIREDAEAQFVQLSHDSPFANKYLEEDPYCEPVQRDPIKDERGGHRHWRWLGRHAHSRTPGPSRHRRSQNC